MNNLGSSLRFDPDFGFLLMSGPPARYFLWAGYFLASGAR